MGWLIIYFLCSRFKAASNNIISAPIFIGINSSRNPDTLEITGLPPEFTPYLLRGGSDKLVIIRGSLKDRGIQGFYIRH